jgi:DNA (cytosine-5)-methyltransferase 1
MSKPKLLDLFCCAGGAGMGYHLAGFEVVGVDNRPQPHYPFEFIQGDALEVMMEIGHNFDFIHASPPCQFYSELTPGAYKAFHPHLIPTVRHRLMHLAKPYIIENVAGAKTYLDNPLMLCGSMFGLPIWRHRFFENNIGLFLSPATCNHNFIQVLVSGVTTRRTPILISGRGMRQVEGRRRKENTAEEKRQAMGIDWMTEKEVTEALPPAYTNWLGLQAIQHLKGIAA